MGSPAARLGDPTVHGGTITIGFPTVVIGGQPAARIGDMHVCPQVTVVVPHVGGPLVFGSFTVLTGGVPQSRVGDALICVGPPDAVAMGCPTVLVGMAGGGLGFGAILHGLTAGLVNFPMQLLNPIKNPEVVRRGNIIVAVDRVQKTIIIFGVQEYSGAGADQAYVDKATQQINSTWSGITTFEGGQYKVDSRICGRGLGAQESPTPGANQINVVETNDPPSITSVSDPSNQPFYGDGTGHQHSTDTDGGVLIPAHEFGHSLGLPDRYTEGVDANGNRTTTPDGPGLMSQIGPGAKPTPDDYNAVITGNGLH